MPPEVAEFGPVAPDDEQGRPGAKSIPSLAHRGMSLTQAQIPQRGFQSVTHDCAAPEPNLIDALGRDPAAAVSQTIHQKDSNAGNSMDRFPRPPFHDVRWNHGQRP